METAVFGGFGRLDCHVGNNASYYVAMVSAIDRKMFRTCKIGKLQYVAGAEIPKRYLLQVDL